MPLSTDARLGPYEILGPLGAGGMGEVYRAKDTRLDREVAIKVLPAALAQDPERLARSEREAKVLASLNHPNIAQIHGLEESNGVRALVMELVPGETLRGPLPFVTALKYAGQIAEALEAAHEKGITHRDLKPANIMVTPEGVVKVLDFGLAAIAQSAAANGSDPANSPTMTFAATQAGIIMGTAGYMSPEQAAGRPVDRRADIWSFGVVLHELLSGKALFTGETVSHTLASVLKDPIDLDIPQAPPAVRRLLARCLERDPRNRLRDIGEARIAIDEILRGTPAEPALADVALPRPPARAWMAIAGVFFLASLVLAALYFRQSPEPARTIRFPVALEQKGGSSPFEYPVVSPDGKRIAFTDVSSAGGSRTLRIRSLDSMSVQTLPGTDGVLLPFWSPDSRFIAFFAQGKLKRIDISGGSPLTICGYNGGSGGGAWSPEGVIIFGSPLNGPLHRVSAAGGEAKPLTQLDQSRNETAHVRPQFLPDGRHFLYLAIANEANSGVYIGSLDSKDTSRLVAGDSSAVYTPPFSEAGFGGSGYLLFARGEALMAQNFDPKALRLSGEPFPITEQVGRTTYPAGAAFSASRNGVLAYRADSSVEITQLAWFDRSGKRLESVGAPGVYSNPALSPDEKRVAVARYDPAAKTRDIWVFDLTRGTSSRFTFDPADETNPTWSPDGSRIAFTSERKGQRDIYQKLASGTGEEETVLESGERKAVETWSPDGRFLLYNRSDREIWALPLSGDRKPVHLLPSPGGTTMSQISPNGRWIAYRSNESGRPEIYVQSFAGTSTGPGKWQISTAGGTEPVWRRDGKELFYMSSAGLMAVDVKTDGASLEAGIPKTLFELRLPSQTRRNRYVAAANGQRFLINTLAEEVGPTTFNVVVNWQGGLKK